MGRLYICPQNAKRIRIIINSLTNEYYAIYKNLLSQTNKYVTDYKTPLSKIKILFNEPINEDNIIKLV